MLAYQGEGIVVVTNSRIGEGEKLSPSEDLITQRHCLDQYHRYNQTIGSQLLAIL